jgi:NodT family efflux transporter outer membrane factor (OMF) lipoprotein
MRLGRRNAAGLPTRGFALDSPPSGWLAMGWLAMGSLALGAGACAGPNFHRPAPPAAARYVAEPLADTPAVSGLPGGDAQRFLTAADVPRNWWTLFGSDELDRLVDAALRANPSVAAAQAALRQAHENTAAQRGSYFPTVQANASASRQRDAVGVLSPNLTSGTALYDLYTPQVTVSFVPDIFGANRRAVESLAAQEEATRFDLDATYLTLAANVATTAITAASLRDEIAATQQVIALAGDSLNVMRRQFELGSIAEAVVYAEESALAALEATLPPLARQLALTEDQLAVLTGRLPADQTPSPLKLDDLTLPADLPLGVPSQLVERRPDVRAAEAQLHAATAAVGVAVANLLPQISITGNLGSSATATGDLFKAGTGFWSIGASLTQTLFAGGQLVHRKRAAEAAMDQAGATYQSTVLTAFQNVADALHALETDGAALSAASRAEVAARNTLNVVRHQVELGSVNYLALLSAQQAYEQALVNAIQARAGRYADTAALFQALGGAVAPLPPSG